MPQALADSNIAEELRQRGLLATGGNIRLMPFAGTANANGVTAAPSSSDSGNTLQPNPDGTLTVPDATGNPVTVDPKSTTPEELQQLPDESVNRLMPFLTGALGAATALYLAKRNGATPTTGSETGDMVAARNAPVGDDIINGEFTEVPPNAALNDSAVAGALTEQKKLSGPANRVEAMGSPAKYITSQDIARQKAGSTTTAPSGPTVQLADEFTDFAPEELATARAIAQRLVDERRVGNQRYQKGKTGVGKPAKPTSRGRLTESVDEMMGVVAKVLRDQKALRSLGKVAR